MRLLLLPLFAFLFASASAQARSVFDVYGGSGDRQVIDECPKGQYFAGVVGHTGAWVDQIAVICAFIYPNGTTHGHKTLPARGGSGGGYSEGKCLPNSVVRAITATRTAAYQIRGLGLFCENLNEQQIGVSSMTGTSDFIVDLYRHNRCPPGEAATGLIINYGRHVNGLGLICDAFRPSYATVLKDVDVYNREGGNAVDKQNLPLRAGTAQVGIEEIKRPWFHVRWPGGSGWVYSARDYLSLRLPR